MKTLSAIVTLLVIVAAAPTQAQPPATPTTASPHYTTGNTPIGTLLADPAAKAIVDKHIPGFSENPQISVVSSATLLQIQSMKPDLLTDGLLSAIDADLAGIPGK